MYELEHVLSVQNVLGEGPLWNVEEQALYWLDLRGYTLHRFWTANQAHEVFDMGMRVGSLGFRASGSLVLATNNGFCYWDTETRRMDFIANPIAGKEKASFNDGKVDRKGRFWAGSVTIGERKPQNALYRLDPGGEIHTMITGVTISNGIGWSPDDKMIYFVDSWRNTIYAYDFDLETGEISNRRPFVEMYQKDGYPVPDGLTVDSEGYVWCAIFGGFRIVRYDPSGKADREIVLPFPRPTSCIFGGKNLDELYITTARLTEGEEQPHPLAGDLFRIKTDIKGLPEPKFGG